MAVSFTYTPPKINAAAVLAAVAPVAVEAAAKHILSVAEPLTPKDTGKLVGSGRVEVEGHEARIIFDAVAPDGYAYGIRQHEDLTLHHPNGGQSKFLEQPLHTEQAAAGAILAATVRRVFEL